jgi:hypothetical protein
MKQLTLALALLILGGNANAIYNPEWERPIFGAEMEITHTNRGFEGVSEVNLVLTKRDGENEMTGMILSFLQAHPLKGFIGEVERELVITNISKDNCGSTIYNAQLATSHDLPLEDVQARFSISLTDHSTRLCEDYRPYGWEAHVREGYGWCGTMDATMELVGNPEPLRTIMLR